MNESAGKIAGRATAALVFAGFGSVWLCIGLFALHRLAIIGAIGILTLFAVHAIPAIRLLRRAPDVPRDGTGNNSRTGLRRAFHRIVVIEFAAIFAAVGILGALHRPRFIVPATAAIVGFHFLPLANVFMYPALYVTGLLLILWSSGIMIFLPRDEFVLICSIGAGVILLLSSTYALVSAHSLTNTDGRVENRHETI